MGNETITAAIILAAGRGMRAGGDVAKQWQILRDRRVLDWTLQAMRAAPDVDRLVLVLNPNEMYRAADYPDVLAVPGGDTRAASVQAGLDALVDQNAHKVLIHDGARPLVSQQIISDVLAALDHAKAAAPGLEITDALWRGADGQVTGTRTREGLYRAQTPQGFHFEVIRAAHGRYVGAAADDVEVARAAGIDVAMVRGEERNLKITRAKDFKRAEAYLTMTFGGRMDIRVGNGFDVHAFKDGDNLTLCGVAFPHDKALLGHSDADVAMHALTDAIYGAMAEGDIGRHFPPTEEEWRGAESHIFLSHAVELAARNGFRIGNVDLTIICERPKVGPRAIEMAERLAGIIGIGSDRISVKATTSEKLGFTGREEGIASMATVTLVSA